MRRSHARRLAVLLAVVAVVGLLQVPGALAQSAVVKPEALAGKWEGSATSGGGDLAITMVLRVEKGVLLGTIDSPQAQIQVTGSTITGDKVVLSADMAGTPGTLAGSYKEGHVEGTWVFGEMTGTFSVTKATDAGKPTAPAAASADSGAKPNAADPISGQWDGVAGEGEMARPFTLTLKLDGDKVTGDITSEQGGTTLSSGAWKNGALTVAFALGEMSITMSGTIKEGKLIGTLDVGGQMQMAWAAVKK